MRVLLTGASGFIGSRILARLLDEGAQVIATARSVSGRARPAPAARWVSVDLSRAGPETWVPLLRGVDAVVNCAGVLQDSPRDSTAGVHHRGAAALFEACEQAGVRRVVHFSAIGVDRGGLSAFSRTKRAGDEDLMRRDLDWVVLRPSVVVGRGAYGGSALFRGLAALPVAPRMAEAGPLQVVQLEDVVETVVRLLGPDAPRRVALELAGPKRQSFEAVVEAYRAWLGWPPARVVTLPAAATSFLFRLGDLAGLLGWRAPIRSTAQREIARGAVGDPQPWTELTHVEPTSLARALARAPATVQDRWFAGLYLLKPVIFTALALYWILTGVVSLGPGYEAAEGIMRRAGGGEFSGLAVLAGGLADVAIGVGLALRRTARAANWAAIALSLFYLAAGTLLAPGLWLDPLGALLKIGPIVALHLAALAILEDR